MLNRYDGIAPLQMFDQPANLNAVNHKVARNDANLVAQSTDQLLRAVKKRMLKRNGRVDYAKLRKDGYSEKIVVRLETV